MRARPSSRHLYAGRRSSSNQVSLELILGAGKSPDFDVILNVSTLPQWFARARLLGPHLIPSCRTFSSTLTTMAFDHSSLRWFETRPWSLASKGLPSSLVQLRTASGYTKPSAALVAQLPDVISASLSPGVVFHNFLEERVRDFSE